MRNTLCPYSLRPLSQCLEVNGEHILPSAFGAPESFTVPADASENQRINVELDAPTINMSVLRMIAMSQGIKTRSGEIELRTVGVIQETGEEVNSSLSSRGYTASFRKPVGVNDQTGHVEVVKGIGDDAMKMAEAIKARYKKKGIQVEIGDPISIQNPWINHKLVLDLNLLGRMLAKISYLMTVRLFGDEAIQSESGSTYRAAFMAADIEALKKTGIGGGYCEMMPWFLPRPQATGHSLSCFKMGKLIVASVSLFGMFHAFFTTPATNFSASEADGEVIHIDVTTSKLSTAPYIDSVFDLLKTLQGGSES